MSSCIAVATTYGTGTIVRIGEKLALGLRRAERSSGDRRSATIVVLRVPSAVLLMIVVYIRSSAGWFTIR